MVATKKLTKLIINGTVIVTSTGKIIDYPTKDGLVKIVRFNTSDASVREPSWSNTEVKAEYFTPGEAGYGTFVLSFTGRDYKLESVGEVNFR